MPDFRFISSLPALLGATVFVVYHFVVRPRNERNVITDILAIIKRLPHGCDDKAVDYASLPLATIKALFNGNLELQSQLGEQKVRLLQDLIHRHYRFSYFINALAAGLFLFGLCAQVYLNNTRRNPHHEGMSTMQSLYPQIESVPTFQKERLKRHLDVTSHIIQRSNETDRNEIEQRISYVQASLAYMAGSWDVAYSLAKGDSEEAVLLRGEAAWRLEARSSKAFAEAEKLRGLKNPGIRALWFLKVTQIASIPRPVDSTVPEIDARIQQVDAINKELTELANRLEAIPGEDASATRQDILAATLTAILLHLELHCDAKSKGARREYTDISNTVDAAVTVRKQILDYESLTPGHLDASPKPLIPVAAALLRADLIVDLHRVIARLNGLFPDIDAGTVDRFKGYYPSDHDRLANTLNVVYLSFRDKLEYHCAGGYFTLGQTEFQQRRYTESVNHLERVEHITHSRSDDPILSGNGRFILSVASTIVARESIAKAGVRSIAEHKQRIEKAIAYFRARRAGVGGLGPCLVVFSDALLMEVFVLSFVEHKEADADVLLAEYREILATCERGKALACRHAWEDRLRSEPDDGVKSKAIQIVRTVRL